MKHEAAAPGCRWESTQRTNLQTLRYAWPWSGVGRNSQDCGTSPLGPVQRGGGEAN